MEDGLINGKNRNRGVIGRLCVGTLRFGLIQVCPALRTESSRSSLSVYLSAICSPHPRPQQLLPGYLLTAPLLPSPVFQRILLLFSSTPSRYLLLILPERHLLCFLLLLRLLVSFSLLFFSCVCI